MIRHIVAIRFREGVPEQEKAGYYAALQGLSVHLPGIMEFRSFANVSPEDAVVHGFRDLFWIDFQNAQARDAYLVDPGHQAIGARLVAAAEGGVDGIQVLDIVLE
jgi:hypothetical protein